MTLTIQQSLSELPEYRRVLVNLIARDLKVKYQTKALGFLWSLLYLFVLGVSLPLAGWTVIYRDLEHMVTLALMALFYLTPVFWSLSFIGDKPWKLLFALNPVLDFIELFRGPLYWGTWPNNG